MPDTRQRLEKRRDPSIGTGSAILFSELPDQHSLHSLAIPRKAKRYSRIRTNAIFSDPELEILEFYNLITRLRPHSEDGEFFWGRVVLEILRIEIVASVVLLIY